MDTKKNKNNKKKENNIKSSQTNSDEKSSNNVTENFKDKLAKFIFMDNLIRQETIEYREKIETLKSQKDYLSEYIMRYLENINENIIELGDNGTIRKYESVRKGGINKEIIEQSIYEKLKQEKIEMTDEECKKLASATYEAMNNKREIKTKTTLKRTIKKSKTKK